MCICVMSVVLQKLDRAWYDFDGGYDDRNNPFADIPEEYTKKKEEQMAKHAVKRMSAQQRQINKVSSLSLSVCLSVSLPPSLSLSLCFSLSLSLSFSLSLSLPSHLLFLSLYTPISLPLHCTILQYTNVLSINFSYAHFKLSRHILSMTYVRMHVSSCTCTQNCTCALC